MRLLCKTTDSSDGGYNYATVDIDVERVKELLTMRPIWDQTQKLLPSLYCLEIFDATPEFYESVDLDNLSEDDQYRVENGEFIEVPTIGEAFVPVYGEQHSTCVETLRITKDGVLWSASPKYGEGSFETLELSWKRLEEIAAH